MTGLRVGLGCLVLVVGMGTAWGQDAPSMGAGPVLRSRDRAAETPRSEERVQETPPVMEPAAKYDPAMFLKPMTTAQTAMLAPFDGAATSELMRDKSFRKQMKKFVPNCVFHYGRDMSLDDALDAVMKDSRVPVRVRDGRYLLASGAQGPYLAGRGFLWVDLKTGIGLGGFFFHPTNGEPTPSLVVFSRQVKEDALELRELPPAFLEDMNRWASLSNVPLVLTQYFITGENRRVLLEHDVDYCSPADGAVAGPECEQMIADAADMDLNAAYYLEQVNYRTNATAWMIGPEQTAFIGIRERTCGGLVNPLGCRIRLTRERVHVVVRRGHR